MVLVGLVLVGGLVVWLVLLVDLVEMVESVIS